MTRIDLIKKRLEKRHLSYSDFEVIGPLVYTLSPQDACEFFDFTFEQDFHIRRYVLRKICNDITKDYLPKHRQLLVSLLNKLDEKGFNKKQSCGYSIDFLYDSLPAKEKRRILRILLFSKSSRNRDRVLKRIKLNWNKKYHKVIEQVWNIYKDPYALDIIINNFPIEFLRINYKTLLQHTQPYQTSKLFLKLGKVDFSIVKELQNIDEISYAYVLTKFGKKLSEAEAKEIIEKNYKDDRIGLLLWCYGQMGLWESIVEYDDNYREKHNLAKLDKFVSP